MDMQTKQIQIDEISYAKEEVNAINQLLSDVEEGKVEISSFRREQLLNNKGYLEKVILGVN